MKKAFREIRIIPVVLVAIFGLAVLKIAGLVLDGGYVFGYDPKSAKSSWAQEMLNFPGGKDPDLTGSAHGGGKKEEKKEEPKISAPLTHPGGVVLKPEEPQPTIPPAERAILERLQQRRQELDARARELEIRENLLKAAEKRIESKTEEVKATEARISAAAGQKGEEGAKLKNIVTMYEGMKPKDAAKVFDRLEMGVLLEIAMAIAPRKMSDILGLMQPEAAERLTVEMARRAGGGGDRNMNSTAELPKIEGKIVPPKSN